MGSNSLTLAPAPRSAAAEEVRAEVRQFLADELAAGSFTPHVDTWLSGVDPVFSRKLGERGWLGMTWPRRHGGEERGGVGGVGRARGVGDGALCGDRGAAGRRCAGGGALDRRPAVRAEPAAVWHRG